MLCASNPAWAQPQEDLEPGWHIVRPGETPGGARRRYLGSSELWKQLAQLNPDIPDPDRIEPGQRIRVLLPRRAPLAVAQVERVSRKVDEQPQPNPWVEARAGDLLVERDAVRTYRALVGGHGVPRRHQPGGHRGLPGLPEPRRQRAAVGPLPLRGDRGGPGGRGGRSPPGPADPDPEIEIVLGHDPRPLAPRLRRPLRRKGPGARPQGRGGGAKVMVYGGDGEVEAGGAEGRGRPGHGHVGRGPGPAVAARAAAAGAPAPRPGARRRVPVRQSPALLGAGAGAESYVVEVCRDAACDELVERATGIAASSWRAPALPAGDYHWRITARSRSGLDGYPGETSLVAIRAEALDQVPPTGAIHIAGPSVRIGERLVFGPATRLEVAVADDGSGLKGWTPAVDGREAEAASLAGPWPDGDHEAGAVAVDLCGNLGPIEPVSFTVDAEPPAVSWERGGGRRGERGKGRFGSPAAPSPRTCARPASPGR